MNAINPAHRAAAERRAELHAELGAAPSPEELVSYHNGTLDEGDRRRVRAYLALSPEAAQTVLDLDQLPAADEGDTYDVEASWRRLQASLPVSTSAPEQPFEVRPRSNPWLLAALVVLGLGASFGLGHWTRPATTYSQLVTATLSIEEFRGAPRAVLLVPADAEAVSLSLLAREPSTEGGWRVEVWRLDGGTERLLSRPVWPQEESYFQLVLRAAMLTDGSYEVRLLSTSGGTPEPRRYLLEVKRAPGDT